MIRIKLILSYDGYYINGWTGTNGIFVDNLLSEAIYKLCGDKVICHCAGRTDKGVHALYQVCHFDLTKEYKRDYINHQLTCDKITFTIKNMVGWFFIFIKIIKIIYSFQY